MKRLFSLILLIVVSVVFVRTQVPKKKTGLTKNDRAKWFKVLKWDTTDDFQSEIDRFENSGFTFYRLDKERWLVQIITGAGAYQRSHVYAVLNESYTKKPTAKLLKFTDYQLGEKGKIDKETNAFITGISTFSYKEKTLTVFYKAAGLGHCGSLTTYKIVGNKARTIEARLRGCENATNFPPPEKWQKIKIF
jgi:hypothetical protein